MIPGKLNDIAGFIRVLSMSRMYNLILIYLSYYYSILFKRPFHQGMPFSISVEPTTSCNLQCPECPSGLRKFSRPTGNISFGRFKEYIDKAGSNLVYLMLYFQGEPFLNKDIFQIISYARSKRVYTTTSTNGHFLSGIDNAEKLIDSGLNRLIISFDGTTQVAYEKYRRGGDLQQVKDGIVNLVSMKKKLGVSHPYIILQFLVMGHNEHQMAEARKFAKYHGLKIEFKSAQVYDPHQDEGFIPRINKNYSRYHKQKDGSYSLKSTLPDRCFRMWSGLVITWDGKVVPCCFDKDASYVLGDLNNQEMREIWKGQEYQKFRTAILKKRSSIDICRNCTEGLKKVKS